MNKLNPMILGLSLFFALAGFIMPTLEMQVFLFLLASVGVMFYGSQYQKSQETQFSELIEAVSECINQELFAEPVDEIMEQNGVSRLQILESLGMIRRVMEDFKEQQGKITHLLLGHVQQFHETAAEQWEDSMRLQKESYQLLQEKMGTLSEEIIEHQKYVRDTWKQQEQVFQNILQPVEKNQEIVNRNFNKLLEEVLSLEKTLLELEQNSVYQVPPQPTVVHDNSQTMIVKQMKGYMGKIEKISDYFEEFVEEHHGIEDILTKQTAVLQELLSPQEGLLHSIKKIQEQQVDIFTNQQSTLNNISVASQLQITALADQSEIFITVESHLEDEKRHLESLLLSSKEQSTHLAQSLMALKHLITYEQEQVNLLQQQKELITAMSSFPTGSSTLEKEVTSKKVDENLPHKELDESLQSLSKLWEDTELTTSQKELAEESIGDIAHFVRTQLSDLMEKMKKEEKEEIK